MSQDQNATPAPASDQFDWTGSKEIATAPTSDGGTGGIAEDVKMYWRKASDFVSGMPGPGGIGTALAMSDEFQKQIIDNEINHAHPVRAVLGTMYFGAQKDAAHILDSFAKPTNIALQGLTGGASALAKIIAFGSNLYFTFRGGQTVLQSQQESESSADALQRRLLGTAQVASGAAGTGSNIKDQIHSAVQDNLGLKGDLASKVAAKIMASNAVETAAKAQIDTIAAATKAQVASTTEIASGIKESLAQELPIRLEKIMADASQAVMIEKARVDNIWDDLHKAATAPVTDAADLRAEIVNTLQSHGIQDREIPQSIFNALPRADTTVRALTASELKASTMVGKFADSGMSGSAIRDSLVNLGYVPAQIDAIMLVGAPHLASETALSLQDTIRVKNDLWNAAQSAKDSTIQNGLLEAHANLSGMQSRYAVEHNLGNSNKQVTVGGEPKTINGMLENARKQYEKFKNELGSGTMRDFVEAKKGEDRAMLKWTSDLIDPHVGEFLQNTLRQAGVDISPIKALDTESKAVAAGASERVKEITKQSAAMVKDIKTQTGDTIDAIGNAKSIIPKQSDLQLAGKTTEQIRQDAVERLASNSRAAGITNPYAYIQITMGMARLLAQSFFGAVQLASGGTRVGVQKMLRSPAFQDWIAQESGVSGEPYLTKFNKGTANLYLHLRKLAESSVLARGTANANDQKPAPSAPIVMPSPAPSKPSGNISIAGTQ